MKLLHDNISQDFIKIHFTHHTHCFVKEVLQNLIYLTKQRAKKVVSDSRGLVEFAFGLVNSVLNLSDGQVNFSGKFKLQKDGNQSC